VALVALATLLIGMGIGAVASGEDDSPERVVATAEAPRDAEETRPDQTTASTQPRTTTTAEVEVGTRENPLPLGQVATLAEQGQPSWEVKVTAFAPDGTQQVLAENQFNEPPAAGRQFALVTLEAKYVGSEQTSTPGGAIEFSAVDSGNVTYDVDDYCGVIPDALDQYGDVFQGGVVTGNVCWSVDSAAIDSLVLIIEPFLSFDAEPYFMALR
jgi:hypothetical protein